MNKKYINNLETGKIELHFTKSEYQSLSEDLKKELKSSFLFSRYSSAWVSRSKNNHYFALKVAEKLGFTEEEKQGQRLSYAEELNIKAEKAEHRIERYEEYAGNAVKRAETLQKDFNNHRGDIAFLTQPNINSSSGRSFTNYRNKVMNRYDKGFEEYRKSDYFKEKAAASQATADKTQLKNRAYLCNRIKECDSTIKKYESYIVAAEEKLNKGDEAASERIEKYLGELEYQIDKKAFMQNCLDDLGGLQYSKENIKSGYMVKIRRDWELVIKANRTTVEVKTNCGLCLKYPYGEIKEVQIPEKVEAEELKNPYNVNDILVTYNVSGNRIINAYQVLKTTAKGVQIQRINIVDNKPVKDSFTLDKPCRKGIVKSKYSDFVGCYDGDWQLHLYNNDSMKGAACNA